MSAAAAQERPPPPYAPSLASTEALDGCTVGHERLLETLVTGLRATLRDGGARFELLVGPPGSGKTHLLRSLYQRLRTSRGSSKARLVLLHERAVLGSLSDLLARTIERLQERDARDDALRRALRLEPADAAELLEARLAELLGDRPLFLFVEELGDILEAGGEGEQQRLRAMLQNRGRWSLISSGLRPSPAFTRAAAPLFGTFAIRTLPPLGAELCQELRLRRGEGPPPSLASTRALHHLLGGWPRPMVLAQRLGLGDRDLGELALALGDLLEQELGCVERHLPRGRGSVLQAIVHEVRPLSPSTLAEQLHGVSPSAVTAQLKILRDDGVVVAHRVGRSSYYELASSTQLLVAARRAHPERLATLARFLRLWYAEGDARAQKVLGGRSATQPGDALLALDLATLAGLEPATVAAMRRALELRNEASADLPAALTEAAHAFARSTPAERLLLDQCLAGLGRRDLLGAHLRLAPRL